MPESFSRSLRTTEDMPPPRAVRSNGNSSLSSRLVHRNDWIGSVARFWLKTYAQDYVGLAILIVLYFLVQFIMEPFHPLFTLDNIAIQYPHAEVERVNPGMLVVYGVAVPAAVLAVWAILWRPGVHAVQVTYLGLFISLFLCGFITDVIKNFVGRTRPDFLARCQAASGTPEHTLVDISVCQTRGHVLTDGNRSFPSGHSSLAFSGLGYLSLFFAGQTHLLHPHTQLPSAILPLIPMLAALLIAISRCEDYRHDVWDVTAGSILGFLVALFSYRRYYPSLWTVHCDLPYPSMADGNRAQLAKLKREDEESWVGAGPSTNNGAGNRGYASDNAESAGEEAQQSLLKGTRNGAGARDDNGR